MPASSNGPSPSSSRAKRVARARVSAPLLTAVKPPPALAKPLPALAKPLPAPAKPLPILATPPSALDWSGLHAFAEVAHCGSVLRAARLLGLTQPTVSRQIAALEARLGYPLFQRSPRGMRLNARGQALLAPVERMRMESHALARLAQGQQESLAGNVRISASEIVSAYMLPAMLGAIRERHPQLDFTIVASNQLSNLIEREADIAVRMVRPQQAGLVTRHVGDFRVVMAAHRRYLQRAGVPRDPARLFDWQMIGFDHDRSLERAFASHGIAPALQRWAYRCDSHAVCWQLVRQGMGIGFVTDWVADSDPDIVRVLPELPTPLLPVWLTMHRDVRASPRLRLVFDELAQAFARLTAPPSAASPPPAGAGPVTAGVRRKPR